MESQSTGILHSRVREGWKTYLGKHFANLVANRIEQAESSRVGCRNAHHSLPLPQRGRSVSPPRRPRLRKTEGEQETRPGQRLCFGAWSRPLNKPTGIPPNCQPTAKYVRKRLGGRLVPHQATSWPEIQEWGRSRSAECAPD